MCSRTYSFDYHSIWMVSLLSVVPLKIWKNNCKPGETHRETSFIREIPTLYRANLAETGTNTSEGTTSICHN